MAEKTIARIRVKQIYFAEPIAAEGSLASASWEKAPFTYRDDEVSITTEEPEKEELPVHEQDTPIAVSYVGKGYTLKGSFTNVTVEQLKKLLGGEKKTNAYHHSTSLAQIKKAIKFELHDGGTVILPNGEGFISLALNLGKGGLVKCPFSFSCLRASEAWDCDMVITPA